MGGALGGGAGRRMRALRPPPRLADPLPAARGLMLPSASTGTGGGGESGASGGCRYRRGRPPTPHPATLGAGDAGPLFDRVTQAIQATSHYDFLAVRK